MNHKSRAKLVLILTNVQNVDFQLSCNARNFVENVLDYIGAFLGWCGRWPLSILKICRINTQVLFHLVLIEILIGLFWFLQIDWSLTAHFKFHEISPYFSQLSWSTKTTPVVQNMTVENSLSFVKHLPVKYYQISPEICLNILVQQLMFISP